MYSSLCRKGNGISQGAEALSQIPFLFWYYIVESRYLQPTWGKMLKIYIKIKILDIIGKSGFFSYGSVSDAYTMPGVNEMKEEERKPLSWEVADPKLPVVRSGHMENRKK